MSIYESVYIGNNVIRLVNNQGIISTIAGNGNAGFSVDNYSSLLAELNHPNGLVLDLEAKNLLIADGGNNLIRKVTLTAVPGCCMPVNGVFVSEPCVSGSFDVVGNNTEFHVCDDNTKEGYFKISSCISGSYNTPGSNTVYECDYGFYVNASIDDVNNDSIGCEPCLDGFYCLRGATSLMSCPNGM